MHFQVLIKNKKKTKLFYLKKKELLLFYKVITSKIRLTKNKFNKNKMKKNKIIL